MSGFVVIRREALSHHLIGSSPQHFYAWCWLIANAAWKPTKFDINGKTVTLKRGQICASVRQLGGAWSMSKSAVDRFLSRLETETMIGRDAGHGRLIITICNYAKYQDRPKGGRDTGGTATGTAAGHERDIKEQGNKVTREEPSGSSLPPTPHRDPDWPELPDWIPVEAWNGWLEMRRRKGKAAWPTARAIELTVGKLEQWRAKGHDPAAVLDEATMKNWTGINEPKSTGAFNDRNRHHHQADNVEPLHTWSRAIAERQAERAAGSRG